MPSAPYYHVKLGKTDVSALKPGMDVWGVVDGTEFATKFYKLDTYYILNALFGTSTGYALQITNTEDVILRHDDNVDHAISVDIYIGYKKGEKRLILGEFIMDV